MKLTLALAAALLILGCKKDEKKEGAKPEQPVATAVDAAAKAAAAPDAASPPPPPPAAPDAAPAMKTEVVTVEPIGMENIKVQLDAPVGAKVELDPGGEEQFPRGSIYVGELEILIQDPDSGHWTLDEQKSSILANQNKPSIDRADADPDGYTLIWSEEKDGVREWRVEVDRPGIDTSCGSWQVKSRADADMVAAVCRSMRKVP